MVDEWAVDGIKPITYCSSYIGDLSDIGVDTSDYFSEGDQKGYFVKNKEGKTYSLYSVSLRFAIIDFTNPDAREWCKNIIKENVIKEARSGGWMHDFGEYLPFDAVMSNGADPLVYHNEYVTEWARCAYEVL
jgi:sulfoquinovosidase